jgi:hypothetical protein
MLATVIAYVASGQKNGIFMNQLETRANSEVYNRGGE